MHRPDLARGAYKTRLPRNLNEVKWLELPKNNATRGEAARCNGVMSNDMGGGYLSEGERSRGPGGGLVAGGGAPGSQTVTERAGRLGSTAQIQMRIDHARGLIEIARAELLPRLRGLLVTSSMDAARAVARDLTRDLSELDRELREARRMTRDPQDLAEIAEVGAAADELRDAAIPLLAQVSPMSAPRTEDGGAALIAHGLPSAEPNNVIDASTRFDAGRAPSPIDQPAVWDEQRSTIEDAVQRRASGAPSQDVDIPRVAAAGVTGAGERLPHLEAIQRSFGAHDVSGISSHVGGAAADAASAIGAEAYATGNSVAFASAPSLFVAAHEAAHVVQQRAGVQLLGGVGEAGDVYERHADEVAERVVRGDSAADLLSAPAHGGPSGNVQRRDAATTAASSARLTSWPSTETLGEHFVGTSTDKRIYAPWNISTDTADASVTLTGDGFTLASPAKFTLLPTSNAQAAAFQEAFSPLVRFAPERSGRFAAMLTVEVAWPDGHVERKVTIVTAAARRIDQVTERGEREEDPGIDPAVARAADAASQTLTDTAAGARVSTDDRHAFDEATDQAAYEAGQLTAAEAAGVGIAKDEVDEYQRELAPDEPSLWWGVLDIAMTMAVGGLAGTLARRLGPKLAHTFAAAASGPEFVPVVKTALKDASAGLVSFTTDAVKDGLKSAAKRVIANAAKPPKQTKEHTKPEARERRSANRKIDFFAEQQAIIRSAAGDYRALVKARAVDLHPLLALAPDHAMQAMRDIGDAFTESNADAEQAHANATAIQWVSLVAQASLGSDAITDDDLAPGAERGRVAKATTELSAARKPAALPEAADGLVDLWIDETNGSATVTKVRLHGISASIIARMMDVPLGDLRVPLRFNIAPAAKSDRRSVVTVDEVLRIRAVGDFEALGGHVPRTNNAPATSEIDANAGTAALIDPLLRQTLRSFSSAVDEDDANGDVE
jgi:hypothetical protein